MSWLNEIDNCIKTSDAKIEFQKNVVEKQESNIQRKKTCQPRTKQAKAVKQLIRNIDYKRKTALVESRAGKVYPVILSDQALAKNVTETDLAIVKKVNGYWIMIDVEKPMKMDSSTAELFKLSNWIDIHRKRKLKTKQPIKIRINNWVMRNFGFLLLLIVFLMLILFMIFSFQIVGASLESGNYYNHLGDVI